MGRSRSRSRDRRRDRSRDRRSRDRDRDRDRRGGERDAPKERREEKEPQEEEEPEDDTFRPGRQVIVKGLQKNPEKNGSLGSLVEFNKDKGRWVVSLSGGNHNFKEENLELMPDNSDIINEKEEPPTAKIYVQHLAADCTEDDLIKFFGGCGVIAKQRPKDSRNRGFEDQWPYAVKLYKPGKEDGDASVEFMDPYAAKAAIKTYNRYKWKGNKLKISYAGQGRTYEQVELQLPWHMREENQGKLDREGGGKGGKPGDWQCPGCGENVFASKDSCFKCGESKPGSGDSGKGGDRDDDRGKGGGKYGGGDRDDDRGGGKDGGKYGDKGKDKGKGKGGKPGDWECPSCGANNFARNQECFKCGTSRPDDGGGGGGKGKGKGKDKW